MEEVAITGLGVVSPLGSSLGEMLRHLADGAPQASAACEIPLGVVPAEKRTHIGRLDRLCRLFLSASYLAAADARLRFEADEEERIGLSFGTGLGCLLTNAEYYDKFLEQGPVGASPRLFAYTVSSAAAGEVSIALGIKGPNVTQHLGFAAGAGALGYGFDLIAMGKADVVLAGGADANGGAIVEALRDMGLLKSAAQSRPFLDAVPGLWPSEGCAVAVLERADRAAARGAHAPASIAGYAAGFEPTMASASPASTGVVETMRRALAQSGIAADDVDLVVSSAHGTPADAAERAATLEVFGTRPLVLAPKALFGEAFAASSVLGLALSIGMTSPPSREQTGVAAPAAATDGRRASPFFTGSGDPVDLAEGLRRARNAKVVMVQAVCYSGNTVSLVVTRRE